MWGDGSVNSMKGILSQCISNDHVVHFKYGTILMLILPQ